MPTQAELQAALALCSSGDSITEAELMKILMRPGGGQPFNEGDARRVLAHAGGGPFDPSALAAQWATVPAAPAEFDAEPYRHALTALRMRAVAAEPAVDAILLQAMAVAADGKDDAFEVVRTGPDAPVGPDGKRLVMSVKSLDSALAKIKRLGKSSTDAAKPLLLNDAIRFTVLLDEKTYLSFLERLFATLESASEQQGVGVEIHQLRNYWSQQSPTRALMLIMRVTDGGSEAAVTPPGAAMPLAGTLCAELQIFCKHHVSVWEETTKLHHVIRAMPPGPECDAAVAKKASLWLEADAATDAALVERLQSPTSPLLHPKELRSYPKHWYASAQPARAHVLHDISGGKMDRAAIAADLKAVGLFTVGLAARRLSGGRATFGASLGSGVADGAPAPAGAAGVGLGQITCLESSVLQQLES